SGSREEIVKEALLICVVVGGLAVSQAAWADDDNRYKQPLNVFGVGLNSCGQYLQAFEGERKARSPGASPDAVYTLPYSGYLDFVDGFLTGANFAETAAAR